MNAKSLALGVIDDLRARRLMPVALLLLAALVAIPVLMLKPAGDPPTPPTAAAATKNVSQNGLPSPQEALNGSKPLVTMAVLQDPSTLESFESKNPFNPMRELAAAKGDSAATGDGSSAAPGLGTLTSTGPGGATKEGATTGGGAPDTPATTTPTTTTPTTETTPQPPATPTPEKKVTYAVDLTLEGPRGTRRYKALPRLQTLPSTTQPLFVFLGIEDGGTKAVFLVDATLRSLTGEATCTPSPAECGTLTIEPGQRHSFTNDAGQKWTIQIDQVRETSVASAARAARVLSRRQRASARASVGTTRRFVAPVFTDFFLGGQS